MSIRYAIRAALANIPVINRLVFSDADSIYKAQIRNGMLDAIRMADAKERAVLHFSYGRWMRNRYLLWHPKNPYTSIPLFNEPEEAQASSAYHPDNYSWSIISRLIVAADAPSLPMGSPYYKVQDGTSYNLLMSDDSFETLNALEKVAREFGEAKKWKELDSLFEDAANLHASPDKMKAVMQGAAGFEDRISYRNLSRVARMTTIYGQNHD